MKRQKKSKSECLVTKGKIDLTRYEELDQAWRQLGLAAPARRGLVDANLFRLTDLSKITKAQFLAIHGIGPNAAQKIITAMKGQKIDFKD